MHLAHPFHLVANGLKGAGAAVGRQAFQNVGQRLCDIVHLLCCLRQVCNGGITGQKDHLHALDVRISVVGADVARADAAEADAAAQRIAADAHLLTVALAGNAYHIALGKDVVLNELHIADGLKRCLVILSEDLVHL